ncbi:MAG: acyl-CoA dehydrogenase family protein [Balneolaceae bacterium]|nr:acyl-CoA dehydrogenase family protein [Balneolaceae bacterium]
MTTINPTFDTFITGYHQRLSDLFSSKQTQSRLGLQRQFPKEFMNDVLECKPLSVFIPEAYGGRGGDSAEALSMLEASSYHSLPLSLMMGINGALFLQPVANYASDATKSSIFKGVLEQRKMGGLMITEPGFGSDALRMQTSYHDEGQAYRVKGTKHWAGLTGEADYWLITARPQNEEGELGRDVSFFVHPSENGGIEVEEVFNNLGLYMLPYGRNQIDISVPDSHKLKPKTIGIKMMLDVLHRSRLQFPGMSTGFLGRLVDEGMTHCKERFVGGSSLFTYDQVKSRLSKLQSYFTASSAMAFFVSRHVPLSMDTSKMDLEANAVKSVSTDYMQAASQNLLQLVGAKGYRLDHIAGRAVVDSRPFQIFEGSNDILYQQITESVLKLMRGAKETNLYHFCAEHPLTNKVAEGLRQSLDFEVNPQMAQRKLVSLGQALGRLITMNMTVEMGAKGFASDSIQQTIHVMESEIKQILTGYHQAPVPVAVQDESYATMKGWRSFL